MKMGRRPCLRHTQERTTAATHADAVQSEQSDVVVREPADEVLCDSHHADTVWGGVTAQSVQGSVSFADVEAHTEFAAADDQEEPTSENQPSVSRAYTSCADAGIIAESDQSCSRHDSIFDRSCCMYHFS